MIRIIQAVTIKQLKGTLTWSPWQRVRTPMIQSTQLERDFIKGSDESDSESDEGSHARRANHAMGVADFGSISRAPKKKKPRRNRRAHLGVGDRRDVGAR